MQNYTTIIGNINMHQRGISYDNCPTRYGIGNSTLQLIMKRFKECGKTLDSLKQMPLGEVENLFSPPKKIRSKDASVMPDYQAVYSRLTISGSKANLFYLWLKYKTEHPSGYQYTQFCKYFNDFIRNNYRADAVSMVVERIPREQVYTGWSYCRIALATTTNGMTFIDIVGRYSDEKCIT